MDDHDDHDDHDGDNHDEHDHDHDMIMMITMMPIIANAGKANGKADGRGGEDGCRALQASHGAQRLD